MSWAPSKETECRAPSPTSRASADRQGMVAIWLQHLSADDDGGHASETGEPNSEFCVPLPSSEAAFGLSAHWNVAWRPEFLYRGRC